MRTIFLIFLFATISLTAYSQSSQNHQVTEKPKSVDELRSIAVSYRLFATQNMWTFIKLNTRNGQMWQVQFDVQGKNRQEVHLSLLPLVTTENETNDRFTLYPTQNMNIFILLDQLDGRVWQVQWSTKAENRGVIPIN